MSELDPPKKVFYPEYDNLRVEELGAEFERLDAESTRMEEAHKAVKARIEHLRVHRIPKALEAAGLKNMRLASGRGVTTENKMFVSSRAEQKPALIEWLRNSGNDGLVQEVVNPQTLKVFVKGCLEDGKEFPADLIQVTVQPQAKFFK